MPLRAPTNGNRLCVAKPKIKCGACPNQAFLPLTDEVIEGHLRGRHTIGVYPIRADDTCRFLARRLRQESMAEGRRGLRRSLSVEAGSGGTRTLALGQRRARLDLLRGPECPLLGGPSCSVPIF